jgi:hypothetical protein
MVTITNHGRLSQVFRTKTGSRSLPPGATDIFDLVDPNDRQVVALKVAGVITVKDVSPPAAPQPLKSDAGSGAVKS